MKNPLPWNIAIKSVKKGDQNILKQLLGTYPESIQASDKDTEYPHTERAHQIAQATKLYM